MESERTHQLRALLAERILILDGAAGTYFQQQQLNADDFGGEALEGCNEHLTLTRPQLVQQMHREYLEAGCDIIETNTFGGTPLVLAEYDLEQRAVEINLHAAHLAREAADAASTPERPRFVAGSMGPTTRAISVTGGITFAELEQQYYIQAEALLRGGVDYLLLETCQDTRNVKAALCALDRLRETQGRDTPLAISCTIEATGTMLAGQGVEAFYTSLMMRPLLYLGMNCATGPAFMTDYVRSLAALAHFPLAVVPNAGLPDEDGNYLETPPMLASVLERFAAAGWLNLAGGCCGTRPEHIRALVERIPKHPPRQAPKHHLSTLSGIDYLEVLEENRPIIVGERANAVGSRAFKRLIEQERYEEAAEITRRQVTGGAQVLDVNLANPDRDELQDMERFLDQLVRKVKTPLMIDSTDAQVIHRALQYHQGKAIINSINLEDGEERFAAVVPSAIQFGAAIVVGTIDEDPEQGMAITCARKLEIAKRSHRLLTETYGMATEDIYFDPLVFPCATGDKNYCGAAAETIESLRQIKAELPGTKTVLGISNISFGLPAAAREVLNAIFLHHCVVAGLDLAIVHAGKLQRYAALSEKEIRLAEDLLFERGEDPIAAYAAHFRGRRPVAAPAESLSLDERLARYVVLGSKDGLIQDLQEALQERAPLKIVNGPLMQGMDEVGRLFNSNQMIVAEVLQSAEVMKASVAFLEPHMERSESAQLGTMVLATVKGDVHDIGKNLVDIIFTNNGYRVINLGIKCPPDRLIAACQEHAPDLLGLSGLLVKSAQQMVVTAEDLAQAGIQVPLIVGGAALSRNFTRKRIAPAYAEGLVAYASDAMSGLELAKNIMNPETRAVLEAELAQADTTSTGPVVERTVQAVPAVRSSRIRVDLPLPPVPDTEIHVQPVLPLDQVWRYLNPHMLYGKHLGLRGNARKLLAQGDPRALALRAQIEEVQQHCRSGGMHARGMWCFVPVTAEGNRLILHPAGKNGSSPSVLEFPRQPKADGLSLPDFVLPAQNGAFDHIAFFVTTAGEGISEQAEIWKEEGAYLKSYALQALALETAEAAAEWLHAHLRTMWNFPDDPEIPMSNLLRARYRGKRFSFGYPACPQLEHQTTLFQLLSPERIGVQLTEGYMMEPEASVSALVFHHPDAMYFSAGTEAASYEALPSEAAASPQS